MTRPVCGAGKLIVVLTALPLLGACVPGLVAGMQRPDVSLPKDPCPDPRPKAVEVLLSQPRPQMLTASMVPAGLQGTDLDVGKQLIGNVAPMVGVQNAASMRAGLTNSLGLNLADFSTGLDDLSESGAAAAEQAFATLAPVSGGKRSKTSTAAIFSQDNSAVAVGKTPSILSVRAIANATAQNGWDSSFVAALGRFYKSGGMASLSAMSNDQSLLYAELVRRFMVAEYFKAYFRNGKIVSVKLSTEKLKAALKAKLESTITDPALRDKVKDDIDSLNDDILKQLCGDNPNCLELGTIGDTTFTTRAGKSYGFAGINVDLDPAGEKKISIKGLELSPEVVSDLVRVFFEALGDYQFGVPGVAKSTACDHSYLCGTTAEADKIAAVDEFADKVEAGTNSLIGIAIRGGWIISLNNEALASGVQTAISVYARKVAEKAAWSRKTNQCPGIGASRPAFVPLDFY